MSKVNYTIKVVISNDRDDRVETITNNYEEESTMHHKVLDLIPNMYEGDYASSNKAKGKR